MLWQVGEDGKVLVRMRSTGVGASQLTHDGVNRYIANIVGDLDETMGIEIVTDELRVSFNKVRPEVNVTWRARVPTDRLRDVREYLSRMAAEAPGE